MEGSLNGSRQGKAVKKDFGKLLSQIFHFTHFTPNLKALSPYRLCSHDQYQLLFNRETKVAT